MHEAQSTLPTPALESARVVFLRMPMVKRRTGLGRSTIYRLIARSEFPSQVRLSGRAVGWREIDIDQWAASRAQASH
jgi:prophage regulatory protein